MSRRVMVILMALGLLLLVALPAMAQTEPAADEMTWETLGTVAGASIAAGVIVQVAGLIFALSARAKRIIAVVSGFGFVVIVTVTTTDPTIPTVGLAVYTGALAGLAASKAHESITHGLNHRIAD